MGLQRIFSATTAVVGLFISVDYGLCDEFRCRGADVGNTSTTTITSEIANNVGWQGRAVWTLFYVIGVALWTLHLSMLEAHVITIPGVSIQFFLFHFSFFNLFLCQRYNLYCSFPKCYLIVFNAVRVIYFINEFISFADNMLCIFYDKFLPFMRTLMMMMLMNINE